MQKKRKISIEDVAARAKVSITTVSRVINKVTTVNKENQARVEEAIAFLKFKPDVNAQRLARGTNNSIALVMPGYPGIFHSFYAIELIRGVGHACEMLHMDLVFHITNGLNPLNHNSVGGLIFADIIENRKQVEAALEGGVSCMVMNNVVTDMKVNYVAIDNFHGGQTATDYLASLGHQRIATVTGNLQTQSGLNRFQGYQDVLMKKKIPVQKNYIIEGDYSRRSARVATEKLLALENPPTAIFAASDDMALEIIAVILERRLKVPDDISVIGFDDNPAALYGPVGLTTIKQPLFEMAEAAVKHLFNLMTGKKNTPVRLVLSPQLIIRESCAPPRKA